MCQPSGSSIDSGSPAGIVRACVVAAGIFGALGVCAGALGAHALEGVLAGRDWESYQTAVRYQLLHALALLAVGALAARRPAAGRAWAHRAVHLAVWAFVLGTVLFSGGIYVWLGTGIKAFVHGVPVGGVLLAAGWAMLAVAGMGLGVRAGPEKSLARGSPAAMEQPQDAAQ